MTLNLPGRGWLQAKSATPPLVFSRYHYLLPAACLMPAKFTKSNLPTKICATCGRPFEWRKKWRNCWDEVKYCGEKCQRNH